MLLYLPSTLNIKFDGDTKEDELEHVKRIVRGWRDPAKKRILARQESGNRRQSTPTQFQTMAEDVFWSNLKNNPLQKVDHF